MSISKAGRAILERQKHIAEINTFAIREGWFIANGGTEIQRDDSDDIGRGFVLVDDFTAIMHIRKCAVTGSVLHKDALEVIGE